MTTNAEVKFKEKIWPSPGFFIATILIIPAMTVLFMPFSRSAGIYIGIGVYLVVILSFMAAAPKVILTDSKLITGRAKIELEYLGQAEALDPISYRQEIGRKLDARAYLAMSGWVKTGVKVAVTDRNDPAPYWIVSTRNPLELAEFLNQSYTRVQA